uniref:Uncharacterized protein n=1 Tax=Moniliophthora roreri TaxID=221103 RepID=A0A0W0FNF3_MONRR
MCRVVNDKFHR